MKLKPIYYTVNLLLSLFICCSSHADQKAAGYNWLNQEGVLSLQYQERIVWTFNYGEEVAKPYFHPITLTDNTVITRFEPESEEHPWHKGLWFSFKYINGINYWEEDKKTRLSQGLTKVVNSEIKTHDDFSATILLTLVYQDKNKLPAIIEQREMTISAPDQKGDFHIDWQSNFTAKQRVELQRTPLVGEPKGKGYGGYAGLSMRFAPLLKKQWQFIRPAQDNNASLHGNMYAWLYFGGKQGGMAIFDHPQNSHLKTSWYVASAMPFFSPAFLFKAGQTYQTGDTWQLKYRVAIYNQAQDAQQLTNTYAID